MRIIAVMRIPAWSSLDPGAFPSRPALVLVAALVALCLPPAALAGSADPPDGLIYDRVIRRLANDRQLKTTAFEVEVRGGVVTVRGTVRKEKLRKRVEKVVKKVDGVKAVDNQVRVRR